MAKYNMPEVVRSLVPEAIVERVQNGVDTCFSEALDLESKTAWKARHKAGTKTREATVTIGAVTRSKWTMARNAPGMLLAFCIDVNNILENYGSLELKTLPGFCGDWFKELSVKVEKDLAEKAKLEAEAKAKAEAEAKKGK